MNQQNLGTSSDPHSELSEKRKRGRPPKDYGLAQGKRSTVFPGSDRMGSSQHIEVDPSDKGMVGQVVSGVVEGSFDAGYFLTVKVGDTDTVLRGVVFQPGHYTPISEANDVAPNARMYKRSNIPVPIGNPQAPFNSSIPQPKQNDERPVRLENQEPLTPVLVPFRFSPGTSFALHKQPASISVCSTSNLSENGLGLSLGKTVSLQKSMDSELPSNPSFALDKRSAHAANTVTDNLPRNDSGLLLGRNVMLQSELENRQVSQSDYNTTVEQCKVIQDLKASPLIGPKMDMGTRTNLNLVLSSTLVVEECETMQDIIEASPLVEGSEVGIEARKDWNLNVASETVVKQCKVMQNFEASSPLAEGTKFDVEASKDMNLDQPLIEESNVMQSGALSPVEGPKVDMEVSKDLNQDLAPNPVILELCEVVHDFEASHQVGGPKVFMEASKNLNLDHASKPMPNIPLGIEAVGQEAQVQLLADGYELQPKELGEAELNIPKLELQLTSVVAETKSEPPLQVDIVMEKHDPPEYVFPPKDFMQLDTPEKFQGELKLLKRPTDR